MYFYKILQDWGNYPLIDTTDPEILFGTKRDIINLPVNVLSVPVVNGINALGLTVKEVQIFVSPPGLKMALHTDGDSIDNGLYAINWIIGKSKTWVMEWFSLINKTDTLSYNKIDRKFIEYTEDECKLEYSKYWNGPAIVNISAPHRIINVSAQCRICVSIRLNEANFLPKFAQ